MPSLAPMPKVTLAPTSAYVKAHATGRWVETMSRALSTRVAKRWQFVSFRGANKGEWCGVVDLIAIRKDTAEPKSDTLKRGDLFDLVLVQVKGRSARADHGGSPQATRGCQALPSPRGRSILLAKRRERDVCGAATRPRMARVIRRRDIRVAARRRTMLDRVVRPLSRGNSPVAARVRVMGEAMPSERNPTEARSDDRVD